MPTECNPGLFDFGSVDGRRVVAAFDGGRVTSDAGALLLGATDKAIGLIERLAGCFRDERRADLVEHQMPALIGQRVFAVALGYEDLVDPTSCASIRFWRRCPGSWRRNAPTAHRSPASRHSTVSVLIKSDRLRWRGCRLRA
jgi:DDE family transposase